MAHAVEGLRQEAERQGVTLTLVTPATVPSLMADPVALEQVVANLTLNAIEASGQSAGRVRVALSAGEGRLSLSVEDNGPGIPPVLLTRIFDPFFTRKPLGRGSGLGLPVALGILQHHGGHSGGGERRAAGARRALRGPDPAGPGAQGRGPAPAIEERRRLREGRRALIIDDEAPVRNPIRRFLERRGWTVEEAEDGVPWVSPACWREDGHGFDLILSDLKMPGLSGIDLHDRLLAERPELMARLVFITGDVVSTDVAAFLQKTARPVLEKPFELSELEIVVERVVGRGD